MAYTIIKTNGEFLTTIADGTINRGSTSLALPGRNYSGYGLYIDQDLVQLLENFSGNVVPANPITGQLWWDTSVPGGVLRVCPADGEVNPAQWRELALGGVGANVTFGNITAENINAANGQFSMDVTANGNITAKMSVFVGDPTNIALYGSNGNVVANSFIANSGVYTRYIGTANAAGITGPGTIDGEWSFSNGNVTFNDPVTFNDTVTFNSDVTNDGNTSLGSLSVDNITVPRAGTGNGTINVSNSNVTFGTNTNFDARNASNVFFEANTFHLYGNAPVSPIYGISDATISNANLQLYATTGMGNSGWINLAANSIALGQTFVTADASSIRIGATGTQTLVISSTTTTFTNSSIVANVPVTINGVTAVNGSSLAVSASTPATFGNTVTIAGAAIVNNNTRVLSLGVGPSGTGNASGTAGEIRATNNITAYYASDARLKTNVRPIEHALAELQKIRGVRYDWTDEYIASKGGEDGKFIRRSDVGVIAQEIEAVLPEIVSENNEGYKGVKYERIVSILIEAVKELAAEVQALKSR